MKKYLCVAGLAICFFTSIFLFTLSAEADAKEIRNEVLRFHIVANSDADTDQQIKMRVRDGVAQLCSDLFYTADSKTQAMKLVSDNSDVLKSHADAILKDLGCSDKTQVNLTKRFFPTRYYEGVSLPAGVYDTVDITIGEGNGKNFWCVMFPDICIGASTKISNTEKMSDILSGDSFEMATSSDSPTVLLKFKTVEIVENLLNFFRTRRTS